MLSLLSGLGAQTSPATATFEELFLTRVRERADARPEAEERLVSDEVSVRVEGPQRSASAPS